MDVEKLESWQQVLGVDNSYFMCHGSQTLKFCFSPLEWTEKESRIGVKIKGSWSLVDMDLNPTSVIT